MFNAIYYSTKGISPILEFFRTIPKKDIAKIFREIDLL